MVQPAMNGNSQEDREDDSRGNPSSYQFQIVYDEVGQVT